MSPAGRTLAAELMRREPRVPEPYRSRMDQALLTTGRAFELWQLRQELLASNPLALLDWEASRHYSGWVQASAFYVGDTDGIGVQRGNDDLRQTSVITWPYLLASFLVDRERCARSDGRLFIEYLMQGPARGTARFAGGMPPDQLQRAMYYAIRVGEDVGPERSPRGRICSYGAGGPAPDGAALLLPAEQAEPRVIEARRALPRTLPVLVGSLLATVKARTPD